MIKDAKMSRTDKDVPYHHKLALYGIPAQHDPVDRNTSYVRDVTLFVRADGLKDLDATLETLPAGAYNVSYKAVYGYPVTEEDYPYYATREEKEQHSIPHMDYILALGEQHAFPWLHHPIVDVREEFEPNVTVRYSTIFFSDQGMRASKTRKALSRPDTFYKISYTIATEHAGFSMQHPEFMTYDQPRDGFDGKGPWKWYKQVDLSRKRAKQTRRRAHDKNNFVPLHNIDVSQIDMDEFDELESSEPLHPTNWADYRY